MKYCAKCGEQYSDRRRTCSRCRFDLMCLPLEMPKQIAFERNAVEVWSKRELKMLKDFGQALTIRLPTPTGTYFIPQHHILSIEQLRYFLSAYENIARVFRLRMVFRGQTRDYFDDRGNLIVLPAVARNETLHEEYRMNGRDLRRALTGWTHVLNKMGIRTD